MVDPWVKWILTLALILLVCYIFNVDPISVIHGIIHGVQNVHQNFHTK